MLLSNNFLDFHAEKGTRFLHPGGLALTDLLLGELTPVKGMRVLEIGCGTGATVVRLTKNYQTHNTAVDFSDKMLKSAKQRAWCSGVLRRINFKKIAGDGLLPFPDNSFDAVFSESVLAIVNEAVLPQLIKEIARVLVPEGKFISNDAIWKDSSRAIDIERINSACLMDFGMVQSVSVPAYKSEWIKLFEILGLELIRVLEKKNTPAVAGLKIKIDLFNFYKSITNFFNPQLFYKRLKFGKALKTAHLNDGDFLESYLFVLKNKK